MKKFIASAAIAAIAAFSGAAPAQTADVGVSISVGEPGFYGRIDIGNVPQPVLVYPRPVVIQLVPMGVVAQPVYLHVPPGHAKNWRKHCARYDACGQPVYFVQDRWYNTVYVPEYRRYREGRYDDRDGERRDHDEHGDRGNHGGKGKRHRGD